MPRVAFIGLGRMGHGMAGRYLDAGFAVTVWNRSKAKADDLIARGARWATSPEDAAIDADAVVTMVADDEASREVWLGQGRRGGDHEGRHARDRMLDGLACACARDGARAALARTDLYRLSRHRPAGGGGRGQADAAGRRRSRRSREGAAVSRADRQRDPAFRRGRIGHGVQADQQSDGRGADREPCRGTGDRRAVRPRHEAGGRGALDRRGRKPAGDPPFQTHGRRAISPARRSRRRCATRMRPMRSRSPRRCCPTCRSAAPRSRPMPRRRRTRPTAAKAR